MNGKSTSILACALVFAFSFVVYADKGRPEHPAVPGSRAPEAPGQVRLEATVVPAVAESTPVPITANSPLGTLIFAGRQGGSESDWSVLGTTNYAVQNARVQFGAIKGVPPAPMPGGGYYVPVQWTITFPEPFAAPPWCMVVTEQGGWLQWSATETTLTIQMHADYPVRWLAIGP